MTARRLIAVTESGKLIGHMHATSFGSADTRLIIIRGNSGSGKSTIARQLQLRHGRGCAVIEQDHLRRIMLRERDKPGGLAPLLIDHTVRFTLDHGYHVILEGILHTERCAPMLTALVTDHAGLSSVFYLDVSFDETVRRHRTRPQVTQFTPDDMRSWYHPRDLLGTPGEQIVPESTTLEQAIAVIATAAGLPLDARDEEPHPVPPAG